MTDNRHPRDIDPVGQAHDDLGFVVDFHDPEPEIDNVAEYDPVDIQIKPTPTGYQIDVAWTDDDGQRRTRGEFISIDETRMTD